ncbi:MAG: LuxR C-terminal-related transcriptional regulator [Ilumatobacteraceae bacterium]
MTELIAVRGRSRSSVPVRSTGLITRKRLDDLFAQTTGTVVRVLAPGGYGKTTLVSGWVEGDSRRLLWLELEQVDDDPVVLATALVRGLEDVCEHVVAEPDTRRIGVAEVIEAVERCDEPIVIVLDGIHHLASVASTAIVDAVAERLDTSSTLVLVGRAHHHSSALRLRRAVVDVTVDDLAFDLLETELLLTSLGLEVDGAALVEIGDQFEGWVAGLRLAGVVMASEDRSDRSHPPAVTRLGDTADVTDYLAAEWIAGLEARDRLFLTEAGCLRRFTGEMCDSVLGRNESAATLRRLGRSEIPVLPLDQYGDWYRMHSLLARWLASDLRGRDRARWREIHVAAAHWWEREGDIDLAIQHARTAGDLDLCERLVVDHGAAHMSSGMYPTARRWMAAFSDKRVAASPQLSALASIAAGHAGEFEQALRWGNSLQSALRRERTSDSDPDDELELQSQVLWASVEIESPFELVRVGVHALSRLPIGWWRAYAGWSLGGNLFLCGDRSAGDVLRQAAFDAELDGATVLTTNCLATCALVTDVIGGGRETDGDLARRAEEMVATDETEHRPPTALIVAYASFTSARSGHRDLAIRARDLARSHLGRFDGAGPWFNIIGRLALVRTCLLLDDVAVARALLGELDSWMATQPDDSPIAEHLVALRRNIDAAATPCIGESWKLTSAELRVLQYLPTHLNLADVADRLYVSRNTVKSHVAAIYRKLGVSTRSEAVVIARDAGLVRDTDPRF